MKVIARIKTDFPTKFGIPRQSGIVDSLKGMIVFEPEYRNPESVRGLEEFSHIWILWEFSEAVRNTWSPTVRPPRLGGNVRVGVFATRSPFRPNPIGLSSVRLDKVEINSECGPVLYVSGVDMMDNTPIFDIKPYIPYSDSHPKASGGFSDLFRDYALEVVFPSELLCLVSEEKQTPLLKVLEQDPRPSYQDDPDRIYGLAFAGFNIRFTVQGRKLKVCEVAEAEKSSK
ncbi:tRNA (N6-threonylcarbamoyladenosine(37)-N6)-methyltransferase TrmO [Parasporobacterium paucivorans]|uniref:tRNA-Thr(GGU) m(6)t(6)A37 methyltransferase TsaA n=1 Tax=Parasporobacterium paucivorans DSM 15970 TaxID=1122934 RepID=A0A1M6GNG3_9FIRM|nr:tRNA (N6-threonylcarbamoyladenosine(37)-N6)-methyltransferase TrmO [Parasporobacterium paucivorans]SHJ11452.1 tRNA-Thr(GGU) m(6)t(6)A37 methyltransferase TsaA [Parasporobacterium paucivorans DSM 15970]